MCKQDIKYRVAGRLTGKISEVVIVPLECSHSTNTASSIAAVRTCLKCRRHFVWCQRRCWPQEGRCRSGPKRGQQAFKAHR